MDYGTRNRVGDVDRTRREGDRKSSPGLSCPVNGCWILLFGVYEVARLGLWGSLVPGW